MRTAATIKPKRKYTRRVKTEVEPQSGGCIRVLSMVIWQSRLFLATDRGMFVQSDEKPSEFKPHSWTVHGTGEKIG